MASAQARGRTGAAKRLLLLMSIAVVAFVLLVGVPEYFSLVDSRDRARTLAIEIARRRQDNAALREQVRRLREDPAAIEDVARRELGMVRRGEILFIIKDVPKPKS
ncbi:MAG: septum formation initiator family protein [Acidobacteria bacterium]|nr:septum formation initiator family protein [Acidobacteriota bacterium]